MTLSGNNFKIDNENALDVYMFDYMQIYQNSYLFIY